ncbi:MAG: PulJ/GspJ family protein, partial [Phycisphaerae bacterium]
MNPHTPIHQRRRSQGFTLMECMVMLPIMAVFLLMAGQLFVACLHTFSNADLRATRMSQRRGLMRELRQDVATAPKLQLQGEHGLICRFGKKREILWLANANGTVTRMCQNGNKSPRPQYWPALLPHLHFA